MKRKYIYIAAMLCSLSVMAQDVTPADSVASVVRERRPLIIDCMPNAEVVQDSAITQLLDRMVNGAEVQHMQGFRVQIFSSNRQQTAKSEAMQLEKQIMNEGSAQVYVQYNPPFWKVRLGNFKTQDDAMTFKNEFVKRHPNLQGDTYVVRDEIEVLQ